MATGLVPFFVFIFGCAIGSFLNVLRYRLPRNMNIVSERSKCPNCHRTIAWYDNIPVASLLVLRRKCRWCGWRIPWVYLIIEVSTGVAFLLVWLNFPLIEVPAYLVLASLLIVCAGIDYDLRIIPDHLTLPGVVLGLVFSVTLLKRGSVEAGLLRSLLGIAVGGGSLVLLAVAYKFFRRIEGMGGGDIKLMAMVGAFLGWKLSLVTIFLGALTGGIIGVAIARRSSLGMKTAVPFGVFLSPAAVASMLWGNALLREYLNLLAR